MFSPILLKCLINICKMIRKTGFPAILLTELNHHKILVLICHVAEAFKPASVVVDLLFYVPPIVCGGSVLVFVLVCITLCPF